MARPVRALEGVDLEGERHVVDFIKHMLLVPFVDLFLVLAHVHSSGRHEEEKEESNRQSQQNRNHNADIVHLRTVINL
jgi:hypothetical protein